MLDQRIELEKVRQAVSPTSVLGLKHACCLMSLVKSDPGARRERVGVLRLAQ